MMEIPEDIYNIITDILSVPGGLEKLKKDILLLRKHVFNNFINLPDDMLKSIFSFCELKDLFEINLCNKLCKKLLLTTDLYDCNMRVISKPKFGRFIRVQDYEYREEYHDVVHLTTCWWDDSFCLNFKNLNSVSLSDNDESEIILPDYIKTLECFDVFKLCSIKGKLDTLFTNCACRLSEVPDTLRYLYCRYSSIYRIPKNLIELECRRCENIKCFPRKLEKLWCDKCNQLNDHDEYIWNKSYLHDLILIYNIPKPLYPLFPESLIFLSCNYCLSIRCFPKNLKELSCIGCDIVQEFPDGLEKIICDKCPLVENFPKSLISLSCNRCPSVEIFPENLLYLSCNDCEYVSEFPEKLIELSCENCLLVEYFPDSLEYLCCNGCDNIKQLPGNLIEYEWEDDDYVLNDEKNIKY